MNVFIDCDPGHDDCMMLILAMFGKMNDVKMNILGISISHGNQTLSKTTENTERFLNLLTKDGKYDFSLYQGFPRKLGGTEDPEGCAMIHGESGLDGTELWPSSSLQQKYPIKQCQHTLQDALKLLQSQEKFIFLCTGPLTNIATLLRWDPLLVSKIEKISIMGGATNGGNTHPRAEFNFQMDPLAASIVFSFQQQIAIQVIPLEITHRAIVTPEILSEIERSKSKFSRLVSELLMFFAKSYAEAFPDFQKGPPLHDPLACFALLSQQFYLKSTVTIDVTSGESIVMLNPDGKVQWCVYFQYDLFWKTFLTAFHEIDQITFLNE